MTEIRVGCSGFQKAQRVYFENYNLVEIQQTFYKPPKPETAQRWRAEAPEDFVFTIKAWQVITHEAYQPTYRRSRLSIGQQEMRRYGSFRWFERFYVSH